MNPVPLFCVRIAGLAGAIGLMVLTAPARAAITMTPAFSTVSETVFDSQIVSNDLINTGQPSLSPPPTSTVTINVGSDVAGTNDGVGATTFTNSTWVQNDGSITYQLNTDTGTGGSATGYDITGLNYFQGWSNGINRIYAKQPWNLQVATLANPAFTTIYSVSYDPFPPDENGVNASLVKLTGIEATGVTGIRFVLNNSTSSEGSIIREIDVFGQASPVPEPASLGLLAVGGLFAARRRRV